MKKCRRIGQNDILESNTCCLIIIKAHFSVSHFAVVFIPFFHFAAGDDQIHDSATNGNHRTDIKPSNKLLPSKKSHEEKKKQHTLCALRHQRLLRRTYTWISTSTFGMHCSANYFPCFQSNGHNIHTALFIYGTLFCLTTPCRVVWRHDTVRPCFKGARERLWRLVFIYAISN